MNSTDGSRVPELPEPDPACASCVVLAAANAELAAANVESAKALKLVTARLAELEAKVEKLEARGRATPRNSSKPPSSEPPWSKPRGKPGSGKRGGQPGHKGSKRDPVPPDEVHAVRPELCPCCGELLLGIDPSPLRHQLIEIPPIRPVVTEYQLHALTCESCGETTRAQLPSGVPQSNFGPNLTAIVATLTGGHRLSKRNMQGLLADVFGVTMSLGGLSNIEKRVGRTLEAPHADALRSLAGSPFKHLDETSWYESNTNSWLWVGVGAHATAFLIRPSRGSAVARELIGDDPVGILITDRWSGYNWVDIEMRQLCRAHLIRDFRQIAESKGTSAIGKELESLVKRLFRLWHLVRDGVLERRLFKKRVKRIRSAMQRLLRCGARRVGWIGPRICRGILKLEEALWTFVSVEGIEPTNNDGERAIRSGVLWRKSSFGTQSDRGSRFAERMMTCAATLKRQGRSLHQFILDSLRAALDGSPAPDLIP